MRKLVVGNLGSNVTPEHLRDFFGLDRDSVIGALCHVEVFRDKGNNHAKLIIPDDLVEDSIAKNGEELFGRVVSIWEEKEKETAKDASNPTPEGPISTVASGLLTLAEAINGMPRMPPVSPAEKPFVLIDVAVGYDCYAVKQVTKASLVNLILETFLADDTMVLVGPRRQNQTTWTLETDKIDLYKEIDFIRDVNGKNIASVRVITPLAQSAGPAFSDTRDRDRERDPLDLVITLVDANRNRFRHITDAEITRKIVEMDVGEIKKSVRVQRVQDSSVPGGNKLVVLRNVVDKTKIPPFLYFGDERMTIRYKGKPYKCHFCGDLHVPGTSCALEDEIRAMEREREDRKTSNNGHLPVKTLSDSTLRNAREGALLSDVDVMSGGTTGNILNAVEVDEASKSADKIVIVAGSNELHRRMDPKEFAVIQELTKQRLTALGSEKDVVILPPPASYSFDAMQQAKQESMSAMLKKLNEETNVTVLENPLDGYEEDNGMHPSPEQTAALLAHINTKFMEVFDTPYTLSTATGAHTVAKRPYAAVSSLYIFGCGACNNRKQNKWSNLCDDCVLRSDEEPFRSIANEILRRMDEIMYTEMPPLDIAENLVEMSEIARNKDARGGSPMMTPPSKRMNSSSAIPPPPSKDKAQE